MKKSKGGRPHEFEPFAALKIVELLKAGNYAETAAASAGLTTMTLRNWRIRGVKASRRGTASAGPVTATRPWSQPFAGLARLLSALAAPREHLDAWLTAFAGACDVAEADAETVPVLIWRKAMAENPTLAEKFLARRYPKRWGNAPAVEVNAGNVEALTIIAPEEREP